MSEFYAHTAPGDRRSWELLFTANCAALSSGECDACERLDPYHGHLNKVAWWTARFAEGLFPPGSADATAARQWGYLAGLWHDLGKYQEDFQAKLRGQAVQVEHSGVGAAWAIQRLGKAVGLPLAFAIAGHHSGLMNVQTRDADNHLTVLVTRLAGAAAACTECSLNFRDVAAAVAAALTMPSWIGPPSDAHNRNEWQRKVSFFTRMIFSALVDADSIATEAFCQPNSLRSLVGGASISNLRLRLDRKLDRLVKSCAPTPVNHWRANILADCRAAAARERGFFSLTVPTGGGKTLAAMSFALRHAEKHGLRRVLVAIPYTSIIEQNAGEYRRLLGGRNVLEHHSNLDQDAVEEAGSEAAIMRRLAAENWDAPIVVTTNVQLFESLHAHKRSRCRKLHNIARSVIVLDEAQCLPPALLDPALIALRELVEHYACTVVLCTATQPALRKRETLPHGIADLPDKEMVTAPLDLARNLARVKFHWPADPTIPEPYDDIAERLAGCACALAVVHRKADARRLAELVETARPGEALFHLSTNMCPLHRRETLRRIREALSLFRTSGVPCRVISTQLIEAGVDLDFPVVFRALAGLDSIAQAAGRGNREGLLSQGDVFVFRAETEPPPGLLRKGLQTTLSRYAAQGPPDLTDPATFEKYFRELYSLCELDQHQIVRETAALNFETVGQKFEWIEESGLQPIVIPWNESARQRVAELVRAAEHVDPAKLRGMLRRLQPFVVQVHPQVVTKLGFALETLYEESPLRLLNWERYPQTYSTAFGLLIPDDEILPAPSALIC